MSGRDLGRTVRAAWAPSLLRRIVRHRATALVGGVGIALWILVSVTGHNAALAEARAQWDDRRSAWVVTERVAAGEPLAGSVERRLLPGVAIPPSAVEHVKPAAVAAVDLFVGDVVVVPRLVGDDDGLDTGTAAVTVEAARPVRLIAVGDVVDLWSVDERSAQATRVVDAALVLAVDGTLFVLAVPEDAVADVAVASFGALVLTRVG